MVMGTVLTRFRWSDGWRDFRRIPSPTPTTWRRLCMDREDYEPPRLMGLEDVDPGGHTVKTATFRRVNDSDGSFEFVEVGA
jgi:hypothetical protein